ncbi:hypothetical protein B0O99DRAFT_713890 [Bisporella sp. PMI_857]|nr:hypothetical protein B0O99DRAFT_713890 [Bisporella sp. PMI_857]
MRVRAGEDGDTRLSIDSKPTTQKDRKINGQVLRLRAWSEIFAILSSSMYRPHKQACGGGICRSVKNVSEYQKLSQVGIEPQAAGRSSDDEAWDKELNGILVSLFSRSIKVVCGAQRVERGRKRGVVAALSSRFLLQRAIAAQLCFRVSGSLVNVWCEDSSCWEEPMRREGWLIRYGPFILNWQTSAKWYCTAPMSTTQAETRYYGRAWAFGQGRHQNHEDRPSPVTTQDHEAKGTACRRGPKNITPPSDGP